MRVLRTPLLVAILFFASSVMAIAMHGNQATQLQRHAASPETRKKAKELANAWVDTASGQTLDQLANRSIAFAGMVAGLYVELDGHWMTANDALVNSALTIIKSQDNDADARAIRNTVYALMEISEGRTFRRR
jgi:hypothetical protein